LVRELWKDSTTFFNEETLNTVEMLKKIAYNSQLKLNDYRNSSEFFCLEEKELLNAEILYLQYLEDQYDAYINLNSNVVKENFTILESMVDKVVIYKNKYNELVEVYTKNNFSEDLSRKIKQEIKDELS
jgi:hypothetical protein